jgi:TRAP-type C4-dicarboxylate transport system permease small subunit
MIRLIQVVDSALTRLVNIALVTLFSVMMGLAFIQVFLRYFFNNSILWGDTAARTLVIWVGFLGAVIATGESKHFHIDVLTRFLKKRHQTWFQSFSNLFAAVICFFLGQASVTFLGLDPGTKTFLEIPIYIVELIIPAGFYLMMIRFVLRMAFNFSEIFETGPSGQGIEDR